MKKLLAAPQNTTVNPWSHMLPLEGMMAMVMRWQTPAATGEDEVS